VVYFNCRAGTGWPDSKAHFRGVQMYAIVFWNVKENRFNSYGSYPSDFIQDYMLPAMIEGRVFGFAVKII
jgi:hypothetical protein